jgi:agmatinase
VKRDGIDVCLKRATNIIKPEKVYISIDLDGIDPAYAPGVSTPEPFGITPDDVKRIISVFGDRIIGADVVELTPPCDHSGISSGLAARLVREIIAVVHKSRSATNAPSATPQTLRPE